MIGDHEKAVLASIGRLKAASADEVAADLSEDTRQVVESIQELVRYGMLRRLARGAPLVAAGVQRLSAAEAEEAVLDVTPRGWLELRS